MLLEGISMRFNHDQSGVAITGTGFYVPPSVLTNFDLPASLVTSDEWIRQRTGIRQRHIANESTKTSELAAIAATKALRQAQLSPEEVDLIIVATSTPDYAFPPTAVLVQQILACRAAAFDLSAACSGFVYALSVGSQMIRAGTYKTVLVIGADVFSKILNWNDRNTAVLFGDGAGAVVLQSRPSSFLCYSLLGADGSGSELLKSPITGPVTMNGREVFKFGVRIFDTLLRKVLTDLKLRIDDISLIIPHQANVRMIERAAELANISLEKVFVNLEKYGNTSAASIPIALAEAIEQKRVRSGDIVALIGFGAGLTWGVQVIQVA
jgi:3-oxoacyl-[acyl-carrier-protein] synthase-3